MQLNATQGNSENTQRALRAPVEAKNQVNQQLNHQDSGVYKWKVSDKPRKNISLE